MKPHHRHPALTGKPLLLTAAVLLLCTWAIGQTQASDTAFAKACREVIQKLNGQIIPSAALAVLKDGRIIWNHTHGFEDSNRLVPTTEQTLYPIGSTSKSLTATALLLLQAKGKLNIAQPVHTYLPQVQFLTPFNEPVQPQVKDFLNMTAGMPHLYNYAYADTPQGYRPQNTTELLRLFGSLNPALAGTFHYSNLSLSVPELLLEQLSGKPFAAVLKEEVYDPLGMKNAFATYTPSVQQKRAVGFAADGKPVGIAYYIEPQAGAGSYATLNDMVGYSRFYLRAFRQWLDGDTANALLPLHEVFNRAWLQKPGTAYAAGWGIINDGRQITFLSNGNVLGGNCSLGLVPQKNIAVVFLSNSTSGINDEACFDLLDGLLPGYRQGLQPLMQEVAEREEPKPFLVADSLKGRWSGRMRYGEKEIPLEIQFNERSAVLAYDTLRSLPVDKLQQVNGLLQFTAAKGISLPQAAGVPNTLRFELAQTKGRITGFAYVTSNYWRPYFALPLLVELKKQ